jgi:hypothetical protein
MIFGRLRIMQTQSLKYAMALLCGFTFSLPGFSCECGAPAAACAYVSAAHVVFVGTPIFSNEDGSGTFLQQTLYKFTVDEIFKGLPEGTKEVWVDPGSYTSCYAEYKLGVKLLVFASEGVLAPADTAAMTVVKPAGKQRPLPPGFDPKMPVYYAPECNGTRDADSATDDIAWLRLWKKGDTRPRIQGLVVEAFNWPLPGTKVIAHGDAGSLTATSDANGAFSIEPVEPGKYELSASLAGYELRWAPEVVVEGRACGYARLPMDSAGAVSGTVVGDSGGPAAGVEIDIARMRGTEETFPSIPRATTTKRGLFRYDGLPAGDYLIGVNIESKPNADRPYVRIYAPGVSDRGGAQLIHLEPGQKISGIRMQLAPRLRLRTVHVNVRWPDGRSAGPGVAVTTNESESGDTDFKTTKKDGSASVRCFVAQGCTIEAWNWLATPGESAPPRRAVSLPTRINAGDTPESLTLVLTETKSGWDE